VIFKPAPGVIDKWFIVFSPDCRHWLTRWLPGRFKHVYAVGWCREARVFTVIDYAFTGVTVFVLPGSNDGDGWLAEITAGCGVLEMPVRAARPRVQPFALCTTFVKHLVGLRSGALRPDALWRDCLRNGAKVISDGLQDETAARNCGTEGGARSGADATGL
jgi:hypothetical protein